MLVPATVATVKTWKFEFPENAFQEGRKYETTFVYKLAKKEIEQENQAKVNVTLNTFHRVEIMATWADVQARDFLFGDDFNRAYRWVVHSWSEINL